MTDISDYDAGLLNDWGGGNVEWWQDYLRAEIARANEHWRSHHTDRIEELEGANILNVSALRMKSKRIEELQAKLANAAVALERSYEGWSNVLELGIIAKQHRTSAGILRDDARATLAELKGGDA